MSTGLCRRFHLLVAVFERRCVERGLCEEIHRDLVSIYHTVCPPGRWGEGSWRGNC